MKKQKIIQYTLTWLLIGILASLISHYIIEILYYNYNYEHVHNIILNSRPELFLLGTGVLFIIYTLFTSVFGSSIIASILLLLISGGFGLATQYKSLFRAEPLFPNELYMIRELPFMFEMIGTKRTLMIIGLILMTVTLMFIIYKKIIQPRKNKKYKRYEYALRTIGIVISLITLFYISRFNYPNNKIKEAYNNHASWVTYNQSKNYSDNGFIAGFLSNLQAPPVEKPDNYSKNEVERIYQKYSDITTEINQNRTNSLDTNVVFVMNESFSDPFNLEGIEANQDPIPFYREIVEESISGQVLAPSIGGGTATNEFQVLTGFSMEPFATQITSPFIQLTSLMTDFPSVIENANESEYRTTAIHPYTPTFYRRNDVYSNLEFDEFRHEDNVKYRENISEKHRYISDFSAYEEVFDVIEQSEEKDFVHLVTIQNHMPYANKYDYTDFDVEGSGNPEEANAYFKDLENSDISLRLLINKIDNYNEPILLVFWGDHLPGFYEGEVLKNNDNINMHETPFLIYSNEMDLSEEVGLISPIYLNNYVTQILNTPVSPYGALLSKLEEQLPVVKDGIYYDNELRDFVSSRDNLSVETLEVLEDYTLLMYDVTTGNNYADDVGFFEVPE